jgi:hypothetical protein
VEDKTLDEPSYQGVCRLMESFGSTVSQFTRVVVYESEYVGSLHVCNCVSYLSCIRSTEYYTQ